MKYEQRRKAIQKQFDLLENQIEKDKEPLVGLSGGNFVFEDYKGNRMQGQAHEIALQVFRQICAEVH